MKQKNYFLTALGSWIIALALIFGIGYFYGTPAAVATFVGLNAACHAAMITPNFGALFQSIQEQLPEISGVTLGSTVRVPLPRDFAHEGFMIVIKPTVSGVAATIAPEGTFALVKKVRLSANDGGQNRDLVNADGMSIVQRHCHYNGNVDTETLTTFNNAFGSATQKTMRLIHMYPPNEIDDPVRSLFLANFPRFNNDPFLEITIGAQADVDTHATPTFAISACTVRVIVFKRFVTTDAWNFLKTDFITQEQAYTNNAAGQRYDIPIPGWHFGVGMRMYSSATALGDFSQTDGLFRIQSLTSVERAIQAIDLRALNAMSIASDVTAGAAGNQRTLSQTAYWFDYLTDLTGAPVQNLDTLLNSNPFVALGTKPQVVADLNGGSGKKIVFMHDRCYGDVSPATYLPRLMAGQKAA